MKYVNAHTILPKDLVEELQKYIQAGYIYIPAAGKKKRWGEHSGYRTELQLRNEGIRQRYVSGCTIEELSTQYALSAHAIKKIIYQISKNAAAFFFSTKQVCTILWLAASAPLPIQ